MSARFTPGPKEAAARRSDELIRDAAPELCEALDEMVAHFAGRAVEDENAVVAEARAVLAKARGEA